MYTFANTNARDDVHKSEQTASGGFVCRVSRKNSGHPRSFSQNPREYVALVREQRSKRPTLGTNKPQVCRRECKRQRQQPHVTMSVRLFAQQPMCELMQDVRAELAVGQLRSIHHDLTGAELRPSGSARMPWSESAPVLAQQSKRADAWQIESAGLHIRGPRSALDVSERQSPFARFPFDAENTLGARSLRVCSGLRKFRDC